MKRLLRGAFAAALTALALAPAPSIAQTFPDRSITMVVPFGPGSGTDQQARAFGQAMTDLIGVPVVIDNKAGASGMIAAEAVARAKPDGYTILMTTNTTHAANEHLFKKLRYDPVKDFTAVTTLLRGYMLMVVSASSPVKSVREFIDLAKSEPGKLTFGSGSSSSRVGGELFKQLAGVDLIHVQYKSNPQAQVDLMGGQLDVVFSDTSSTLPHVRSGKLRALAVTGPQRLEELPDIPTVAEAGVPGYEVSYWTGLYLPAGVPQAIVDRLHAIFIEANASPAMAQQRALTMSEAFVMSPAEMVRFQAAESEKWGKIIRAAGIEPQ